MRDTTFYFVFVAVVISSASALGTFGSCPGGDWVAFEDSKCFKLLRTFTDGHGAAEACQADGNGSTLYRPATIKTQTEQDFITHYVFNQSAVVSSVWFGLKVDEDGDFVWVDDGSQPVYTNWGDGSPENDPSRDCVELQSRLSRVEDGDWKDVPCQRPNYVLCETLQTWAGNELLAAILSLRLELAASNSKIEDHQSKIEGQQTKIENLQKNPVPIGFIYVQLPNKPAPQEIWREVAWTQRTSQYAGLFFRAEGGESAAFGSNQGQSSPRITNVAVNDQETDGPISLPLGGYSQFIYSGSNANGAGVHFGHAFLTSNVETRPSNTAIRIWERTS